MHHSSAKHKEKTTMFEITRNNDDERLEYFVNERMAYKGAIYDFTFEGRFLVYHTKDALGITYYAIDKITDLTSEVTRTQKEYQQFQYPFLIQKILKSIRYTGDRRNLGPDNYDPADLIDVMYFLSASEMYLGYTG